MRGITKLEREHMLEMEKDRNVVCDGFLADALEEAPYFYDEATIDALVSAQRAVAEECYCGDTHYRLTNLGLFALRILTPETEGVCS